MAKKKIIEEIEVAEESKIINIISNLTLQSIKGNRVQFTLAQADEIIDGRSFTVDRAILPPDYDNEKYDILGSFNVILEIKPKGGD